MVAYLGTRSAEALTDDCLVLRNFDGEWHAIPYYWGLRLWPESLRELLPDVGMDPGCSGPGEKRRIHGNGILRFRTNSVPLRMIAFLADDTGEIGEPTLERVPAREAFFSMLSETFSLEIRTEPALRNQFNLIGQLVAEIPAYKLGFPRQFAALPSVGTAILSALAQANRSA